MSVDASGPKGYEYQYKITVLIALLALKEGNTLYVEKAGSEDATLKLGNTTLEIQMKREQSHLDMDKFVNWICHFQERVSDNNLIYRVKKHSSNYALFISRSRCSDDIAPLAKTFSDLSKNTNLKIGKGWKDSFIKELKSFTKFGKRGFELS